MNTSSCWPTTGPKSPAPRKSATTSWPTCPTSSRRRSVPSPCWPRPSSRRPTTQRPCAASPGAHKESARLAALVQDIIELSRLQGANVAQQGRAVDINAVLAEAVDRSQLPAESKAIEIVVGGHADAMVFGDQDLLVTALRNLIDNAIRYSPENTTRRGRSAVQGRPDGRVGHGPGRGLSPRTRNASLSASTASMRPGRAKPAAPALA